MTFLLLTGLVALSGAFVAEWVQLTAGWRVGTRPVALAWLAAGPVAVLGLAAVLVAAAPAVILRRHHLVPVPAGTAGGARFDALVRAAGLRRPVELVWNPSDPTAGAAAFGRPGRYLVRVSPALLAAARRRPDRFDEVVRHELAHLVARDVGLAYFAILSWYAVLPALALPLLLRVVDADLSMVPEYLLRSAVLAAAGYAVRARLLRQREYYADVRAAAGAASPADFARALLRSPARPVRRWPPRWLALHPTAADRARVVTRPQLLARPDPVTVLCAGFAAGAGLPLLWRLFAAVPGWSPLAADRAARLLLYAALGAVLAAEAVRRANSAARRAGPASAIPASAGPAGPGWAGPRPDGPRPDGRRRDGRRLADSGLADAARTVLAVTAGLCTGALVSLGGTAVPLASGQDALAAAVTGSLVGALAVLLGRLAAEWAGARGPLTGVRLGVALAAGAAGTALLADAMTATSSLLGAGERGVALTQLRYAVLAGAGAPVLAAGLALVAAATAGRREWRAALAGSLGGAAAVLASVLVGLRVGDLGPVDVAVRYETASVWLAVLAAVLAAGVVAARAGAAAGVLAAVAGGLLGAAGWPAGLRLLPAAPELGRLAGDVVPLAVVAAIPVLALVLAIRSPAAPAPPGAVPAGPVSRGAGPGGRGRGRRGVGRRAWGVAVPLAAVLAFAAAAVAVVPAAVRGTGGRTDPIAVYLTDDLPFLRAARDTAFFAGQAAEVTPTVSVSADLRETTLPRYDDALADVREVGGYPYVRDEPVVRQLNDAFGAVLAAERAAFSADADAAEHPDPAALRAQRTAIAAARAAWGRWWQAYDTAREAQRRGQGGGAR